MKVRASNPTTVKHKLARSGNRLPLRQRIGRLMAAAADGLEQQHNHSIGYGGVGKTDTIAEANIVLHLGSAALSQNYAAWMECPFASATSRVKHLDLCIDLATNEERPTLLLIEAKRLLLSDRKVKLDEIIEDCRRLKDWPRIRFKPQFFAVSGLDGVYGAVAVIRPDEPNEVPRGDLSFRKWWKTLNGIPTGFPSAQIRTLERLIEHMKRDSVQTTYRDDPEKRLTILYAYAPLDLRPVKGLLDE